MDVLQALTRASPWSGRAACADVPDDFEFVPDGSHEERKPDWVVPRLEYCDRCPVRVECLTFAIETESVGIWGASTTAERNAVIPPAWNRRRHVRDEGEEAIRRKAIPGAVSALEDTFETRLSEWRGKLDAMRRECVDCGGAFFASPKVKAKRCAACRQNKSRVPREERTCRRCGVTFQGHRQRVYCDEHKSTKAPAPSEDEAGAA